MHKCYVTIPLPTKGKTDDCNHTLGTQIDTKLCNGQFDLVERLMWRDDKHATDK